jgi:hypothetical protein
MISSSTKEEIDEWSSNCRRNQLDVLERLNKSIDKYKHSKTTIQGQIEDIRYSIVCSVLHPHLIFIFIVSASMPSPQMRLQGSSRCPRRLMLPPPK